MAKHSEYPLDGGLLSVYPPSGVSHDLAIEYAQPQDRVRLYSSKGSIIAIHGLGTTSPLTWQKNMVDCDGQIVREVNWLSDLDMLPAVLPKVRISTFKWNSNYYENAPATRILDIANTFLSEIKSQRDQV